MLQSESLERLTPPSGDRPPQGWEELVIALVIAGMVAGAFALAHLMFG